MKMKSVVVGVTLALLVGCEMVKNGDGENTPSQTGVGKLTTPMVEALKTKEEKSSYSGGWGYSVQDAVVIAATNESAGVGLEKDFLHIRGYAEVSAYARKRGTKLQEWMPVIHPKQQSLCKVKGKMYDVQQFEVYVEFADGTYMAYDAECWFDISGFFGKE